MYSYRNMLLRTVNDLRSGRIDALYFRYHHQAWLEGCAITGIVQPSAIEPWRNLDAESRSASEDASRFVSCHEATTKTIREYRELRETADGLSAIAEAEARRLMLSITEQPEPIA